MKNIVCSIIIPVYNGEKYLQKTIESCLQQTLLEQIEIILIDDYSTDSSRKIIQQYQNNTNLLCIFNNENLGINKSLNKAIKESQGEYLLLLGQDDLLRPAHIETIISEFDKDTSFIHCNADLIDGNDNIFGLGVNDEIQRKKTKFVQYYLANNNFIHSTGTIIRKSFIDQVGGYDENFKNFGEWLMWIKLASVGKIKYTSSIKALYRKHETNITNTFGDNDVQPELLKYFDFCKKEALNRIKNPFSRLAIILYLNFIIKIRHFFQHQLNIIKHHFKRIINLKTWDNTLGLLFDTKAILYWCDDEVNGNNFGDAINPIIFEKITKRKVIGYKKYIESNSCSAPINIFKRPIYYFIGSILDNLSTKNSIICGTGFQKADAEIKEKPSSIIAVRGPLSREIFLLNGIDCPEVYCDPALLLPRIYPNNNNIKQYDIGIIPHYIDKECLDKINIINNNSLTYKIIDVNDNPEQIIKLIYSSKYIFSSSLHGIIVAHAYGIPATWIKLSDNVIGGKFKFDDYSLGMNSSVMIPYEINGELDLQIGIKKSVLFDTKKREIDFLKALNKHFRVSKS